MVLFVNVDFVNFDVLKLVCFVDFCGFCIFGVFIKFDFMDVGINVFDIFIGRIYLLKFGFVGVVNRS